MTDTTQDAPLSELIDHESIERVHGKLGDALGKYHMVIVQTYDLDKLYQAYAMQAEQIAEDAAKITTLTTDKDAALASVDSLGAQVAVMLSCQTTSREVPTLVWDTEKLNAVTRVLPTAAADWIKRNKGKNDGS